MRTARLYLRFLGVHFRAALEYEADFWIMVVGALLTHVTGLAFLGAVFSRVPRLAGWNFWEIVLMYAMVSIGEGFVSLFFEGMWQLARMVNRGDLDYLLVRPYPVVLQVMSCAVGLSGLGALGTGLVLVGLALAHLSIAWTPATVLLGVLLLVCGVLVKLGISLATNATAFWLHGPNAVVAYAVHHVGELTRYPLTVYTRAVRALLTAVVPLAFVTFFPVSALTGGHAYGWIGLLTPLVAGYCLVVAILMFRRGLRRYESAGN